MNIFISYLASLEKALDTPQVEGLQLDLEKELLRLKSLFETSFVEEAEIVENGFSFESSLKDISRYIVINLIEHLGKDIESTLYIIQNWQRFVLALDDPSLIIEGEQSLHIIFTNVYYLAVEYFTKQFLSHLGEKVELSADLVADPKVRRFIEATGFRQRKFQYSLQNTRVQFVNASAFKTFDIKKSEREKVELLNSLFLRFIVSPHEQEALLQATIGKYPDLESELNSLYLSAQSVSLIAGQKLIEISPPFEEYSYQHDCMVRVYTCTSAGFEVDQYSIPYDPQDLDIAVQNLIATFNANPIVTSCNNTYSSNNILGRFLITDSGNPNNYINSFPTILEYGGSPVLEIADSILIPQINRIKPMIHPLIVQYINSPNFVDESGFNETTNKYKRVFLSAVATLDANIQNANPEVATALESGELLKVAVSGGDVASVLNKASNGAVNSLNVQKDGYCDSVNGIIGGTTSTSTKEVYSKQEVSQMAFKGTITNLTKGKDSPLELQKFVDKNGNELKLFTCPICRAQGNTNYVDICASYCPECRTSLQQMRLEAERGNLDNFAHSIVTSQTVQGNGIFGILFDLFGSVFSIF